MKNILIITIFFIQNILVAQVGIGIENPIATLEILSESKVDPINVSDLNLNPIFKIDKEGNMHLYKALMPNGDAGKEGEYLTSKGSNMAPIWSNKAESSTVQIFSAQSNNISNVDVINGNNRVINFPIVNSKVNSEYGVWNSVKNQFLVNKKGLYHITVGLDADNIRNSNNVANPNGNLALFIGAGMNYQTGANVIYYDGVKYNISTQVTMSIILEPNDVIRADANSGDPNTRWYQGPSFISIQYSEIN